MKIGWLGLALFTGLLVPAQAAMNAKMRTYVVNPMYGSLINFFVGAMAGILVTMVTLWFGQGGNWRGASGAPWWAWCGGLIGATFVTVAILSVPKIGSGSFLVAIVAGQSLGSIVIDHFGWLHVPQHSISTSRIAGAILLMLAVWLIQRN